MKRRFKFVGVLTPLVAVLAGTSIAIAAENPPSAPPQAAPTVAAVPVVLPAGRTYTVTLVTGDVVTVHTRSTGCPLVSVKSTGGGGAQIRRCDSNGHATVVPASVARLVGKTLDPALFDVTTLIAEGYDDAHTAETPLIVEYADAAKARATSTFGNHLRKPRTLSSIHGVAGRQPKNDPAALRNALPALGRSGTAGPVRSIVLDRRVRVDPDTAGSAISGNLTQVGAPQAWATGFTGKGVRVAVLDTGVDAAHPDLAGRIAESANFTDDPDTVDHYGHGTHVAATIAGTGVASAGRYRGVAPDAQVVVGKVFGSDGGGTASQVIAGMEWAAPRAAVVNMSLGGSWPSDGFDPMSLTVDALSKQYGTLFVISAGNDGPYAKTISSPGAAASALTVGAVDATDTLAGFSSRGPLITSRALKPEIVAPGVGIISARAAGTAMGLPINDWYTTASGTSMAAPHVAGAAAVLKQRHPDWTAERLKAGLVAASDPTRGGDVYEVGAGRLDMAQALNSPLPDHATMDLGILPSPQSGTTEAKLGWTNLGSSAATLSLELNVAQRADSSPVPSGAVTLSASSLRVDPGTTGSVVLRVDRARLASRPGHYTGMITTRADDGRQSRTPVGFYVEPPTSTLTLRATPLPGTPQDAFSASVWVKSIDDSSPFEAWDADIPWGGSATLRLPNGRYSITTVLTDSTSGAMRMAQTGDPDVAVTDDATMTFDGSKARPVSATVDGVATEPGSVAVSFVQYDRLGSAWEFGLNADLHDPEFSAALFVAPMPGVDVGRFRAFEYFGLRASGTDPSPYRYDLFRDLGGSLLADPGYRIGPAEHAKLARVDQRFARPDGASGAVVHWRFLTSPDGEGNGADYTVDPPANRTDYVTPGVLSSDLVIYATPGIGSSRWSMEPKVRYTTGSRQEKSWLRQPLRPDWNDGPEAGNCAPKPVQRTAESLHVELVDLVDQHGRFDCDRSDPPAGDAMTRRLTLDRDGQQVGEVNNRTANFTIPRAAGTYRLEYELNATASPISTRVTTAWTFRSSAPAPERWVNVPLLSVDYTLPLDAANHPSGDQATFTVRQANGVAHRAIPTLEAWTSTDDGATWAKATTTAAGQDRFTARLPVIAAGQAVSLRVRVPADAGSAFEQTIIRAYRAG